VYPVYLYKYRDRARYFLEADTEGKSPPKKHFPRCSTLEFSSGTPVTSGNSSDFNEATRTRNGRRYRVHRVPHGVNKIDLARPLTLSPRFHR
jgi:hypothetical protein